MKTYLALPAYFNRLAWSNLAAQSAEQVALVAAPIIAVLAFGAELAATAFFILGAGPTVLVISTAALRQAVTPQRLLGRVSAVNILAYGSRPVGAALGALIGAALGTSACLFAARLGFLAQAAIILCAASAVPRLLKSNVCCRLAKTFQSEDIHCRSSPRASTFSPSSGGA